MDPQSWKLALGCADEMARKHSVESVVLLTHTKDQIRHTSLATSLGEKLAKILDKGGTVALPSGAKLRHATKQTIGTWVSNEVVVVGYGEEGILKFVDGLQGLAGVIVVPEFENSADSWIDRWNPIVLGRERKATVSLIDDPVVETALKTVSDLSNLSHSVMHPRDKQFANEVLRILKSKGHDLKPERIESWAIRSGWQPRAAQELAKLAGKIAGLGSKPSLAKFYDPNGRYARWRKESGLD